jgi:hypothetical protein
MFITTIKLVNFADIFTPRSIVVSGSSSLTDFEISDLTLDANIMGQPNGPKPGGGTFDYARVCVGGLNVFGSNVAVRRVRVIGCGTYQPTNEYMPITPTPGTNECFALWVKNDAIFNYVARTCGHALQYQICAMVKAFNTRKPDGTFVPGYYITGNTHISEITTDVEDAILAI